jgi:hypothetical protein
MKKSTYQYFMLVFLMLVFPVSCTNSMMETSSDAQEVSTSGEIPEKALPSLSITLGTRNINNGITLDMGGDVDTMAIQVGGGEARQSGNGTTLASPDMNNVSDSYMQFNVDDDQLFAGSPTSHVRLEVDYLDEGTDSFSLEYDAGATPTSSGIFADGGYAVKTNSGEIKTAFFNLCDAYFANRDNGADFRIADNTDGAETILEVRVIGLDSGVTTMQVDDFGANPFDEQPDSEAIQLALDSSCSGDTIVFTSGVHTSGYQGYLVDKTLFLTGMGSKHDLTFTASDPQDHALLQATGDLKGYVVRLCAIPSFCEDQGVYNIDFGYVDVDGGRDVRVCMGPDQIGNGVDDNWGSWLPICAEFNNPGCWPGNIAFDGGYSGIKVHDMVSQQGECGSGLSFFLGDGTGNSIQNVTINTVGDHVHVFGCASLDSDGDYGAWSDGMTVKGPNILITNNIIINPSDIGIVSFGGANMIISNNVVRITKGNYGAFAAIAIHPWDIADASGIQIIGNIITSEGDRQCGGLHVGINIGAHMWGGACVRDYVPGTYGNTTCSTNPNPNSVAPCTGSICQLWLVLPEGKVFTLKDNSVTGAQINYLIEGFLIRGQFIDENNISITPRQSDWDAAHSGCNGFYWRVYDKVAHHPSLPGYTDLMIHCER